MHPYDDTVHWITSRNDVVEALAWLRSAGADYGVIHEMTHAKSIEVVQSAYACGATKVEVVGTLASDAKKSSVDMLLITLPEDPTNREQLFSLEASVAKSTGFERSIDEGQKFILLRWT